MGDREPTNRGNGGRHKGHKIRECFNHMSPLLTECSQSLLGERPNAPPRPRTASWMDTAGPSRCTLLHPSAPPKLCAHPVPYFACAVPSPTVSPSSLPLPPAPSVYDPPRPSGLSLTSLPPSHPSASLSLRPPMAPAAALLGDSAYTGDSSVP